MHRNFCENFERWNCEKKTELNRRLRVDRGDREREKMKNASKDEFGEPMSKKPCPESLVEGGARGKIIGAQLKHHRWIHGSTGKTEWDIIFVEKLFFSSQDKIHFFFFSLVDQNGDFRARALIFNKERGHFLGGP